MRENTGEEVLMSPHLGKLQRDGKRDATSDHHDDLVELHVHDMGFSRLPDHCTLPQGSATSSPNSTLHASLDGVFDTKAESFEVPSIPRTSTALEEPSTRPKERMWVGRNSPWAW